MDHGLVPGAFEDREPMLHDCEPARRRARSQPRPAHAEREDPAQGDEGRLVSLRAELLPPLSARGADGAGNRHVDVPSRVPLHRAHRMSSRRKKSVRRRVLTFDDVREIALSMPDVIETTAYGMPAFKAGKRRFAAQPIARPDVEPNSLGVHITFEERDRLMAARPDVYYLTDHFRPH